MTIILSFDVGIINLSYCLIDSNNNNVIDWGIINLNNTYLCELCINNAIYFYNNIYYCKTHKPKQLINNYIELKEEKKYCNYIMKSGNICNKRGYYEDNNCLCKIHYNQFLKNNKVKLIKSCQEYDSIIKNLIIILDNKPELLKNTNHVIIENQPSFKNPKMKSIAITLYNYYLIRGVIDSSLSKVKFISPSNKLKNISEEDKELIKNTEKKKLYKLNKELSIKYCLNFINNNTELVNQFNNNKKKDDMADALLQCIYYMSTIKDT